MRQTAAHQPRITCCEELVRALFTHLIDQILDDQRLNHKNVSKKMVPIFYYLKSVGEVECRQQ
jgi:hypothetical protein